MATTAADVLVETLLHWGVDMVFGIPGDGINGIMEALRTRQDFYKIGTGIDCSKIYPTSRMVSSLTGLAVQRNKAIVRPASLVTTASHTCVRRPPCPSVATHVARPAVAVPRKFALSSIVVNPVSAGVLRTQP